MDRDVLERLITDRALGTLAPDAAALLDAYLEREPEAARLRDEIEGAVQLTRQVLAEDTISSMPAFPIDGLRQIERWRRRVRWTGYITGLAACLVIGVGIGTWMAAQSAAATGSVRIVENRVSPPPLSIGNEMVDNDVTGHDGFWSAERWRQRATDLKPVDKGNITWDSPLSPPRKGDAT